jgi:hypothetical protein
MATHSINSKKHKGGKVKGFGVADGNAADTGTPVTPAPTKKYTAPDVISRPRQPLNAGQGQSGGAENPSSIPPGTQLLSPLAEVLKQAGDDGTLDKIVSGENIADPQLRELAPGNVPDAFGMKSQQKRAGTYDFDTLPSKPGASGTPSK